MAQVLSQNEVDALLNAKTKEFSQEEKGFIIKTGYEFVNHTNSKGIFTEDCKYLIIKGKQKLKNNPIIKGYTQTHNDIKKIVIKGFDEVYFSKKYIEKIRHIFPSASLCFKNANIIIDWKYEGLFFVGCDIYSNQMILYKGTNNTLHGKGAFKEDNNTIDKNLWTNQAISMLRFKYEDMD